MLPPQVLTINRLRGINTKKAITQRAINEANKALNGYFDTTGAFVKRRGFRRINTSEIDSNYDIDSTYQFGTSLIIAGGTDLKERDSGGTVTDLTTSLSGSFFDFEEFIPYKTNYLISTNGLDSPFKFDGTTLTNLSIATPSSAPSAADGSGGSLSAADYIVRVTFIRDNGAGEIQESNPSPSVSVTVTNNRISLSSIPISSDSQVTGRRIYCSRPDGAVLFRQGVIADNSTTTYNIDTEVSVTANVELEYDHDAAPNAYLVEKYKDRLALSGNPDFPSRVYLSKRSQIWYFPQGELDEYRQLYFDIGESVNSIKNYYDQLLIFGNRGNIYVLTGDSPENFYLSTIRNDENVTSVSDRATLVQDNWCYFLNSDGYYRTNGQIIEKVSEPISAFFDPNNQQDGEFNVHGFDTGFNKIVPVAIYYKNLNQILLWITQSGQLNLVNNVCFVMHLNDIASEGYNEIYPNYSVYSGFTTRCTCAYNVDDTTKYILTSQEDGFLFHSETGKYDGAAVNSTATSATSTTLSDTSQSWTTNTYTQLWLLIRKGTGKGQIRPISSNTSDTLTISFSWTITPDSTSEYSIGGIDYQYVHSYNSYGSDSLSKRLMYIRPRLTSEGDSTVKISFGYDFIDTNNSSVDEKTITVNSSSLWDVAQWDEAVWDGPTVIDNKLPGTASRIHRWSNIKVASGLADESVQYDGVDKIYQMKGIR